MMNLLLNIGLTLVILGGSLPCQRRQHPTRCHYRIPVLFYHHPERHAERDPNVRHVPRASASAGRIQEVLETPEDMELTDEPKKNEEEHIVFEKCQLFL